MNTLKALEMAVGLIKEHQLDTKGWKFKFDKAKRRFGCCKYGKKLITLSYELTLLNSEESVKDTILHEIAHALTPRHGHDNVWRKKAIEIGCNGNRCFSYDSVNAVEGNYIAKCNNCGRTHHRYRKPKYFSSCGKCSNTYDERYLLVYRKP